MSIGVTEIDRNAVNRYGESVIDNAQKMYASLSRIQELVSGSKSFYDTESGDSLRQKFMTSAEKFRQFETYMKSYGEYLKNFSGNVEKFEQTMLDGTGQIPTI